MPPKKKAPASAAAKGKSGTKKAAPKASASKAPAPRAKKSQEKVPTSAAAQSAQASLVAAKLQSRLNPFLTATAQPIEGGLQGDEAPSNRSNQGPKKASTTSGTSRFAPPKPRDYTFAGDEIGVDDDQSFAAGSPAGSKKKGGKPSPKKGRGSSSKQQQPQTDFAQLFQSLCLSVRLEMANRRRGASAKLDSMRVPLDEGFLARMEMMHSGEVIRLSNLIQLGELLPDHVQIYKPDGAEGTAPALPVAGGAPDSLDVGNTGDYLVKLKIESVPSLDEITQWLADQQNAARKEVVDTQRGKRNRGDEEKEKKAEAHATAPVLPASPAQPAGASTLLQQVRHQEALTRSAQAVKERATPKGDLKQAATTMAGVAQNDLSKYLSEEKYQAAVDSRRVAEESEQARLDAQELIDLDRLLPIYDLVLSIVGLSRRCYAIAALEVDLVGRTRHAHSGTFGYVVGNRAVPHRTTTPAEDVSRQLRLLMSFPDAGMGEMQPKRLLFGVGDGSESDDLPVGAGGGSSHGGAGSDEDSSSMSAGPGLLLIDSTKTNRLRLSAAIERKKAELLEKVDFVF